MARNPSTPAAWNAAAIDLATYSTTVIPCYCSSHPAGVPMYRNTEARDLAIDDAMTAGDIPTARYILLVAVVTSASRHEVAGDDSRVWLGCADGNNEQQQQYDPAPAGTPVFPLSTGTSADIREDKARRDRDRAERARRAAAVATPR